MSSPDSLFPLSPLSEYWYAVTARKRPHGNCAFLLYEGEVERHCMELAISKALEYFPNLRSTVRSQRLALRRHLVRVPTSAAPTVLWKDFDEAIEPQNYFQRCFDLIRPLYEQGFDLECEMPVRFYLLRFKQHHCCLVINTHHAAADGFVIVRLFSLITLYYQRSIGGERLKELPKQQFESMRRDPVATYQHSVPWDVPFKEAVQRRTRSILHRPGPRPSTAGHKWNLQSVAANRNQLQAIQTAARSLKMTMNDWLNVVVAEAIDEVEGYPEALMAVCIPQNLRRFGAGAADRSNYSSGFYVHIPHRVRHDRNQLAQYFKQEKAKALRMGRSHYNLIMLERLVRIGKWLPLRARMNAIQKLGYYPTTYFCSYLGRVHILPESLDQELSQKSPFQLSPLLGDALVPPNRSTDYNIIAVIFNGQLRIQISSYDAVVDQDKLRRFAIALEHRLGI